MPLGKERTAGVLIASFVAVVINVVEVLHIEETTSRWLPPSLVRYLPLLAILGYVVAVVLMRAKRPFLVPEGTFEHHGGRGSNVLQMHNIGDAPAVEVKVDTISSSLSRMSFETVTVIKSDETKDVPIQYSGDNAQNIFDVGAQVQFVHGMKGGEDRDIPLLIRFTYEDARGRKFVEEGYEFQFIDSEPFMAGNARYLVARRQVEKRDWFRIMKRWLADKIRPDNER